jgi:hypothetical protein
MALLNFPHLGNRPSRIATRVYETSHVRISEPRIWRSELQLGRWDFIDEGFSP